MEKLKSLVPENLKQMVADSDTENLPTTTSSFLTFLCNLPLFHQMVEDLTRSLLCGKNKEDALEFKSKANRFYSSGDCSAALPFYCEALRVAPTDVVDMGKNLVATLYTNRASLFQKIGLLKECLRDCNRALQISPCYSKAWYRRAKGNSLLGNSKDAMNDLSVAKTVELSLAGKRQIESELKILQDQEKGTATNATEKNDNHMEILGEPLNIKLSVVTTTNKGRGIVAPCDIPQASLIHVEEPYAAIILKSCRQSHCHHCFNELPADIVPCSSCSLAFYCSQQCSIRAGGEAYESCHRKAKISEISLKNLEEYIAEVTSCSITGSEDQNFPEHKHECLGVSWPAVFPPDIVLAGRILARSGYQRRGSMQSWFQETQGLSHNYSHLTAESKLELHVYAIVLLCCLEYSEGFELPTNGGSLSQVVLLLCQIRINCMAIVRMKSFDFDNPLDRIGRLQSAAGSTSVLEQVNTREMNFSFSRFMVPVGHAIYIAGSMFNHSCKPNIHAYFVSRTLFIRATEFTAAGCHLELSYGPQVGEWDCNDRVKILANKYSFNCQCSGCSGLNLSDLVLNAFRCINSDCAGVVLDTTKASCESKKLMNIPRSSKIQSLLPQKVMQLDRLITGDLIRLQSGCCLKCGCNRDLESSHEAAEKACTCIKSLQKAIASNKIMNTTLLTALQALNALRSTLHDYNKCIAQSCDILAQAFCLSGDFKSAIDHCMGSIKILEMLYGADHIVVAHELIKLLTIQQSLGEHSLSLAGTISRIDDVFFQYYGRHACIIFPQLEALRREARNY